MCELFKSSQQPQEVKGVGITWCIRLSPTPASLAYSPSPSSQNRWKYFQEESFSHRSLKWWVWGMLLRGETLPLWYPSGCTALEKWLTFFLLQFPHLWNGDSRVLLFYGCCKDPLQNCWKSVITQKSKQPCEGIPAMILSCHQGIPPNARQCIVFTEERSRVNGSL